MGESCSDVGATTVAIEGKAPDTGEDEATIAPKVEMDSPSIIDPSLMGTTVDDVSGLALVHHDEEVRPNEDSLVWLHP